MSTNTSCGEDQESLIHPELNTPSFKLTVELPILAVLFSSSLSDGVTYNLLLHRSCTIDLNYNATICALLHSFNKTEEARKLESEVQAETTILVMILAVFGGIVPAMFSVFLGSWSDKHGRKPLIVWPLFGQVITSVLIMIYSSIPSLSSWWFVLCALPFALLGGSSTVGLGANLIVTDSTEENERSFRLALLQGCGFIGLLIGTAASSYVFEAVGYLLLFTLSATIYFFSLSYTVYCVEESQRHAIRGNFKDLFDCELIKEMTRICFKKRSSIVATILFLLISAYGITMFCVIGLSNIDYLFTRQKFQWLLKEYSIFSAVNTIILVFGMFFGIAIFQSLCKMTDGVLLILAYMSSISEALVRSLSKKSWHMYLAGTMSMLGGLSPPLIRSQITKVIPKEEIAKMYSLVSCVEAILPVFAPMLFNMVYYRTLITFPGAIYVVSGALFILCLCFVTIAEVLFYKLTRNENYTALVNNYD